MWRPGDNQADESPRAFTLLELLIVTSIILILVATLVVATMGVRKSSLVKGTQALLLQIKQATISYYDRYKKYPPDGYDFEVKVYDRTIKGSQCLVYYLATPQPKAARSPDGTIVYQMQEPFLMGLQPRSVTFSLEEIPDREEIPALIDTFKEEIFYDRVLNTAEYSYPLPGDSNPGQPDPRPADAPTVRMGKYQIWSLGPDGRDKKGDPSDDITSWDRK